MKIKKKVDLFDKGVLDVLATWANMRRSKVKESASALSRSLYIMKDYKNNNQNHLIGTIFNINPSDIPVTLERSDNNLNIRCSNETVSIHLDMWEDVNPVWDDSFKTINISTVNMEFFNRKMKSLGAIDTKNSFFGVLLQTFLIRLEHDGYCLIDVNQTKDYGFYLGDIISSELALSFRLFNKAKNTIITVDFHMEGRRTLNNKS